MKTNFDNVREPFYRSWHAHMVYFYYQVKYQDPHYDYLINSYDEVGDVVSRSEKDGIEQVYNALYCLINRNKEKMKRRWWESGKKLEYYNLPVETAIQVLEVMEERFEDGLH